MFSSQDSVLKENFWQGGYNRDCIGKFSNSTNKTSSPQIYTNIPKPETDTAYLNQMNSSSISVPDIFESVPSQKIESNLIEIGESHTGYEEKKMSPFDLEYALLENALRKENHIDYNPVDSSIVSAEDVRFQQPLEVSSNLDHILFGLSRAPPDLKPKSRNEIFMQENNDPFQINTNCYPEVSKIFDKDTEALKNFDETDSHETSGDDGIVESDSFSSGNHKIKLHKVIKKESHTWDRNSKRYLTNTGNNSSFVQNGVINNYGSLRAKESQIPASITCVGGVADPFNPLLITYQNSDPGRNRLQSSASPSSDISVNNSRDVEGIGSHPDLYENLEEEIRKKVDELKAIITAMPRRKLRESLAQGVTIEDVEPVMIVNRDELADMLGLGVTTWKMFVHHTLGIPRWPARALKSQKAKEKKFLEKKIEAEKRGDYEQAERAERELDKLISIHNRRKEIFRIDAKLRVAKSSMKSNRSTCT